MATDVHTIKRGSTKRTLLVYVARLEDRTPLDGLRHDTPGLRAAYVRDGEVPRRVVLVAGTQGVHMDGGFVELDPDLMPGVYQLGVPDAMLAEGSFRVLLAISYPGALVEPIEIDLVAFDPQDPVRLGMSALSPEARVQALRGAFPNLAAKEIAERAKRVEPG